MYKRKFSIILPVKNGGDLVKECVKSILAQTLTDFNLHVLDSCSTDGTLEYLQSLADDRIIIHQSSKPLSIEENWARILTIPKNEFITLIGHDDILCPHYLTHMEGLINQYPDASLYQTAFSYIDINGKEIRQSRAVKEKEQSDEFLKSFLQSNADIMGTGYMMRAKDYEKVGGIPMYPNLLFADFELWFRLTSINCKITSPEKCFSYRVHQSTTARSSDIKYQQAFERCIFFLQKLKTSGSSINNIIEENAIGFIQRNCQGLAHRLLRTPKNKRQGLSVKLFLQKCKEYADKLVPGNSYAPNSNISVRAAQMLDSSAVGRYLFLQFKKIRKKPLLKYLGERG